jgi:hypothetical protein
MKPFTNAAILIFSLIALAHILRLFLRVELIVNDIYIPLWMSIVGAAFFGLLAYLLWRETRMKNKDHLMV